MNITPEYLNNEIKSLKSQRDTALATAQQAIGAIAMAESMLRLVEQKDAMTLEDLRESLGAASAEIVENPPGE